MNIGTSGEPPLPSRTPHFVGYAFFCACVETGIYFVTQIHQAESGRNSRSGSFSLNKLQLLPGFDEDILILLIYITIAFPNPMVPYHRKTMND